MYKKAFNPESVTEIVKRMAKFKIKVFMSFIFGNPGGPLGDLEDNRHYIDEWQKINPNVSYQVCFYTPYPGTPMTDMAISLGYRAPEFLEDYEKDDHFKTKHRNIIALPWLEKSERDDYIRRYYNLFEKEEYVQEWNWRKE